MSAEGVLVWAVILLIQLAAAAWVVARRRPMWPVLSLNLLLGAAVLWLVVPYLAGEVAYIREGEASELFDYKSTILTAFEGVTLVASGFAAWGVRPGKIVAWLGFAGNFVLSMAAALFFLSFKFKCCGYL
jgi:hypothetical protein